MTLFISTVYIAGLLSFFAPCTFALIPVYIGILADTSKKKSHAIIKTLLFIAGLGTTFVTLGFGAGIFGNLFQFEYFSLLAGALIVLMGFHQMGLLRLKFLEKYKSAKFKTFEGHSYFTAYWIGLTFSFAWTPCVGPVLGAVLVVAAEEGQAFYGGWLMLVYTLGLATPFVIFTVLSEVLLKHLSLFDKHLTTIKHIGGFLIVLMGLLLMSGNLSLLTVFFEKLL